MEFHSLIHIRNNICSWLMRQSLMHESDLVGNEDRFETILDFFFCHFQYKLLIEVRLNVCMESENSGTSNIYSSFRMALSIIILMMHKLTTTTKNPTECIFSIVTQRHFA